MSSNKYTTINCLFCLKECEVETREVKRGNGKYCSRSCSSKHHGKVKSESLELNVVCTYCGKAFHKANMKLKLSKHKAYFCCRKHKDLALRKESNISIALPGHYLENNMHDYRNIYIRAMNIISCEVCGYDKHLEILQVHHKDRNRENNTFTNLIALCPNCHEEEHFNARDGKWKINKAKK